MNAFKTTMLTKRLPAFCQGLTPRISTIATTIHRLRSLWQNNNLTTACGKKIALMLLIVASLPAPAHAEFAQPRKFFDLRAARNGGIVAGQFAGKTRDFLRLGDYRGMAPPSVTRRMADRPVDTVKLASLPAGTDAIEDTRPAPRRFMTGDATVPGNKVQHQWPLPQDARQKVTSTYGYRKDPFHGHNAFHAGIDISAPLGSKVLATAGGVVSEVGFGKGLGKYVKIHHEDDSYSIYGHLGRATVPEGKKVSAGQVIGMIGMTGRTTGPHLHFGIKQGDSLVNPVARLSIPAEIRRIYAGLLFKGMVPEKRLNPIKRLDKLAFSR